jgi:rhamnose transport system permease protein
LFPVVVQGEIDISLASTLAVGSVLFALLSVSDVPFLLALPLVLAATAVLGAVNGVLVAYLGLPSLAVTLGTLGAYRGLAYLLAGDAGVVGITPDYLWLGTQRFGGVPASVWLALAVAAAFAGLMGGTSFGRYSYAIGNNAEAARMAAVPVTHIRIGAYALAGAMAGLAGLVWVALYQSARGDNADGAILVVLTAVVLGGVSIKGGSGRALGVLLATLLLGTIQTGMQLANVPGTSQRLVIGALLIGSIGLPRALQLIRQRLDAPIAPSQTNGGVLVKGSTP